MVAIGALFFTLELKKAAVTWGGLPSNSYSCFQT